MTEQGIAVIAVLVFGWAVVSRLLSRWNVTGALLFAVLGLALANPAWGPVKVDVRTPTVHLVAELALTLLLFSDAARVNVGQLRRDAGLPFRLLGFGLPLTLVFGALLAAALLAGLPWGLAGFVGAALAPTDAALSVQVISNERIPLRIRRALNVESGLNDGIAAPIVTIMLAVAASQLGAVAHGEAYEVGFAVRELAIGALVGAVAGAGGGYLVRLTSARGWILPGGRRLGALGLVIASFTIAGGAGGNGFIAAFVAGIAWSAGLGGTADVDETVELPELGGELLAMVVWFIFGGVLLPEALSRAHPEHYLYAVLSLTAVRMLPVALVLVGARLDRATVTFIAWFGPRGLASLVFALIALEQLGRGAEVDLAVSTVALTVALSVVLHGISAGPGARRYVEEEEVAGAFERLTARGNWARR